MARGHEAPFDYHRRLLEDAERLTAYERALRALVRPGDVVLDLGTGTGILAMLAARCGAARVHAVESMPIARVARALVEQNGLSSIVLVHEADAVTLAPIEPVDLVVSDFLGGFLADDRMSAAVAAAGRWLKPGGVFCPSKVRLKLAPVGSFLFQSIDLFECGFYGIDLRGALPYVLNTAFRSDFHPDWLLGPDAEYLVARPPRPAELDRTVELRLARSGRLRGIIGWFDATLAPGIVLSTAPGIDTHWGQYFFPITAVDALADDVLRARIRLVSEDPTLQWRWSGELNRDGRTISTFDLESEERLGERDDPYHSEQRVLAIDPELAWTLSEEAKAAFQHGKYQEAASRWEDAVALLAPDDRENAPPIYENLGIAYSFLHLFPAAIRAFERALDGQLASREQSLRLLITACASGGRPRDALRFRELYEQTFGPLPP